MTDLAPGSGPTTDGGTGVEPPRGRARRVRTRWLVGGLAVVLVAVGAAWALGRGAGGEPRITAQDAVVGASGQDAAAAYLRLANTGSGDDRLVRVSSPQVPDVTMHVTRTEDGLSTMESTDSLAIPAGGTVSLSPGGSHLMLLGATAPMTAGGTVHLHLEFERAPALDVDARIVPLADLADRVGR